MVLKKHILIITGILVLAGIFSSFRPELGLSRRHLRKIDKAIAKTWNDDSLNKELIYLPASIFNSHMINPSVEVSRLKSTTESKGYLVVQKAKGCKIGGCDESSCLLGECLPQHPKTNYEEFIYSIIYNNQLEILDVSVIEYTSEHGFEICNKSWLKQFVGSKSDDVSVGKSIDAISGATVSVQSISTSIHQTGLFMIDVRNLDHSK
ncbi:MAG: FMN-binding protein [Bacteroidales bacterium]|nr:FMN-binding protein [Bacteroidales bacterium]